MILVILAGQNVTGSFYRKAIALLCFMLCWQTADISPRKILKAFAVPARTYRATLISPKLPALRCQLEPWVWGYRQPWGWHSVRSCGISHTTTMSSAAMVNSRKDKYGKRRFLGASTGWI